MIEKLKQLVLTGPKLAEYYEKHRKWDKALREYEKLRNYAKVGKILEKLNRWNEAAGIYIEKNEVDLARRAIETCFRQGGDWEVFKLPNGDTLTIEAWLHHKGQVRRFVRYVQNVLLLNPQGVPLIVVLADKLCKIDEFKSAAELYLKGFYMVNKNPNNPMVKNEIWLRNASECYARDHMLADAAKCMKSLLETEVKIGAGLSKNYRYNPYRNYSFNLQFAKKFQFLPQLVDLLEDFDPFNIAYDLLKIGEVPLSIRLFFKYYGRVAKQDLTENELEIRNEKVSYCLNQYVVYYRDRKEFEKAAEIALMNDQKKIAADLYQMAELSKRLDERTSEYKVTDMRDDEPDIPNPIIEKSGPMRGAQAEDHCPHCGERVDPEWEVCANCKKMLTLNMCDCGQKLKPKWNRCPSCGREIK